MKYYSVERSTDHLAHYGIKGMKWGVRKALAYGNKKALDRHFRKAAKKLAKLQDIGLNSKKYAAKSAAYGAAAVGTGTLAVAGAKKTGQLLQKPLYGVGVSLDKIAAKLPKSHTKNAIAGAGRLLRNTEKNMTKFSNHPYATKLERTFVENAGGERAYYFNGNEWKPVVNTIAKPTITGETIFRVGTGLATAGLAAKSAQNAYRASHGAKYRAKANEWKNEMDRSFAGTKYAGKYVVPPKKKKKKLQHSENYLMHYGVTGMKWGVRKAIKKGNVRALSKQYLKAEKKLAKLTKKADLDTQKAEVKKHNARALAGLGVGLGGAVGYGVHKNNISGAGTWQQKAQSKMNKLRNKIGANGEGTGVGHIAIGGIKRDSKVNNLTPAKKQSAKLHKNTRDVIGDITTALTLAGLGTAGYQAGRSIAAKYRTTKKGHERAVAKRDTFKREMDQTFAGFKPSPKKGRRK